MAPRAFISFEMEDRWARDLLVGQAKNKNNAIEFVDYSVQSPFDSAWKTNAKERIGRTKGTIVLVGPTTSKSDAVVWEIEETKRQGHHIFGVQINAGKTYVVPAGLTPVIVWSIDAIVERLSKWV